jgi:hypothetical protein
MSSFWDHLHISKWNELSINERREALQQLENHYAELQGREPCPIKPTTNPKVLGQYDYSEEIIYLNEQRLLANDKCYEAVNTILHEGRHAYQDYVIGELEGQAVEDEISKWKKNFIGGYLKKEPEYWLQSIEADANIN